MDEYQTTPISNCLHTQEQLSQYCTGGHHPVCLGDTLEDGRYKIIHKLGWGHHSTVWLAKDVTCGRWVSLKIKRANADTTREVSALQELHKAPDTTSLITLYDVFDLHGPNGIHQCLVTEFLGPSLHAVVEGYADDERLEADLIFNVAKQLLRAVDGMHKAGYTHGNIHLANIAFTTTKLANMTEEQLLKVMAFPEVVSLSRADGKPLGIHLPQLMVTGALWSDWVDEDEEGIRILGFGQSFRATMNSNQLSQPIQIQAPELIFKDTATHTVDLWSAGCCIYSLLFKSPPFWNLGNKHEYIMQLNMFAERLPPEWMQHWLQKKPATMYLQYTRPNDEFRLDQMFRDFATDAHLQALKSVIEGLMRLEPSLRLTASEALTILENAHA